MDFLKECLEERNYALIDELEVAGFSEEQAKNFIPVAISGILESAKKLGIDQTMNNLHQQPALLLSSINTVFISQQIGIAPTKFATGIKAVAPVFLEVYSQSKSGLINTLFSLVTPPAKLIIKSTRKFLN